jgi:hypothetical protein
LATISARISSAMVIALFRLPSALSVEVSNHGCAMGESRPAERADYHRALTTCHEQEPTMAKKSRKKKARKKSAANHGKRPNS